MIILSKINSFNPTSRYARDNQLEKLTLQDFMCKASTIIHKKTSSNITELFEDRSVSTGIAEKTFQNMIRHRFFNTTKFRIEKVPFGGQVILDTH